MNALEIAGLCLVLIGVPWSIKELAAWRDQWNHGRHVIRQAAEDAAFYGSMNLGAEQAWKSGQLDEWDELALLSLRDDPGPGGPDWSSGPPGPDFQMWADRNAGRFDSALSGLGSDHTLSGVPSPLTPADGWLDAQLEDLFTWVRAQWTEPA